MREGGEFSAKIWGDGYIQVGTCRSVGLAWVDSALLSRIDLCRMPLDATAGRPEPVSGESITTRCWDDKGRRFCNAKKPQMAELAGFVESSLR